MVFRRETILKGDRALAFPEAAKYVIIGAGVHGLSTAYYLALELKDRRRGSGDRKSVV